MKVQRIAFQGDLMVKRVAELPADTTVVAPVDGQYIVAHSETGHHHVIRADGCAMHEANPLLCYLVLDRDMSITHKRSWDTHEPLEIGGGIWEVRRQREWTPEGERRAAD